MKPKKYVVPSEFTVTEHGVFKKKVINDGKGNNIVSPVQITYSKCYVTDMAKVDDEDVWFRIVVFWDYDLQRKEMFIPQRLFVQKGGPLVQMLADAGLSIVPGKESQLLEYLSSFLPKDRTVLTRKTGATRDLQHYVLSSRSIIGPENGRRIRFLPEQNCPAEDAIGSKGEPDAYKERILRPAVGNPLMIFAILVSLLSVLVRFLRIDNGGFHLSGFTSKGKTTLMQIASSVFGNGSDPNRSRKSYIQRWSMSLSGAEGLAAAFSEKLLCLDELDSFTGDLVALLYFFSGGRGKTAMNAGRSLQAIRTWYINLLSSGEKTLREMVVQLGGKPMEGMFVRFVEIPVGDEIFLETGGLPKAEFAEKIKEACSECYGTLGPEFIKALLHDLSGDQEDQVSVDDLRENHEQFTRELMLPGMRPEHQRALRRFSGAWLAGELAIHYGLVPFSEADVKEAVIFARDLWLRSADQDTYLMQGLIRFQSFIRDNMDSFASTADIDATEHNCPGFHHPTRDVYLFFPEQLKAASGDCSPVEIARELRGRSLLITHEGGRLTIKHPMASHGGKKENVYAVRAEILNLQFGPKIVELTSHGDLEALEVVHEEES